MLNLTTGLDAVSSSGAQQPQYILDAITAFLSERTAPRPKFFGHIMEDPEKFLRDLEGYFNAQAVPKWRRLETAATAATALTEDAAACWKTNQYFAESYEDFEEMLLDIYDSKEVWDQLSAQLGRRNKSTTETMAEFLEQKGVLARRLKLDDELHLPQLVDMFGPAVLPYLQASQPVPPTNETREEKIVIPENNTEVNDIGEMEEEAESHANSEGDELVAATEEVEILGNDADAEVDVVRDKEINIDPEEDETVEEEIIDDKILDKVASVNVGQDLEPLDHAVPVVLGDLHTHGGKQCPRTEVHAKSGTQEASKQNAPRRKGESNVIFNRPRHHSTDTKADALRMSDVENGKVRERTRSPPEEDVLYGFMWVAENVGPVHILVINVGVSKVASLMGDNIVLTKEIFDTKVIAFRITTREAIKEIKKNNVDGHVVHINNMNCVGIDGKPNILSHSTFIVTALTEQHRKELVAAKSKIKITSVHPEHVAILERSDSNACKSARRILTPKNIACKIR
ncbi:hypothetical protein FQA39_LY02361 [Lamprigera yunnana]|nr:hypothetical protein FQA39_LY02361 [Lamprigera yunnana]